MKCTEVFYFFMMAALLGSSSAADCLDTTEDYSPCSCYDYGTGPSVSCLGVPISAVQNVFTRTSQILDYYQLWLSPMANESYIPAYLINDKRFSFIWLSCQKSTVTVDIDAFRSSQGYTERVYYDTCNVTNLDSFTNFQRLETLEFRYAVELGRTLETLPPLRSLTNLKIDYSEGLSDLKTFPTLVNPLESLTLFYSKNLTNEAAQRIVDGVAKTSNESLQYLNLMFNYLTTVPPSVASFKNLSTLSLQYNTLPVIESDVLPEFANSNLTLSLSPSQITVIRPASFRGNFKNGVININSDKLSRFESSVFKDVLQQMFESSGKVQISGNPIDCTDDPCHLTWLIRDNRHLLPHVESGTCLASGNRVSFAQLNPADFYNCLSTGPFICDNDGLFPNPESCDTFFDCQGGKPTKKNCNVGEAFNSLIQECDVVANVPQCFPCQVDGFYEIPNSCTEFISCNNGQPSVEECSKGLFFNPDPIVMNCDFPQNVDKVCPASNFESRQIHKRRSSIKRT